MRENIKIKICSLKSYLKHFCFQTKLSYFKDEYIFSWKTRNNNSKISLLYTNTHILSHISNSTIMDWCIHICTHKYVHIPTHSNAHAQSVTRTLLMVPVHKEKNRTVTIWKHDKPPLSTSGNNAEPSKTQSIRKTVFLAPKIQLK